MANDKVSSQELLLDVSVAEASKLYKFYLNQESKILGSAAIIVFLLINAARSFGASEWQIFKSVVFPSTLPFLLTGLRIAVGRALVGVLVGELYAATAGIGFMITVAGATFQTDKVFVGVLIFAISGILLTEILDRIEHRFEKWRPNVGAQD